MRIVIQEGRVRFDGEKRGTESCSEAPSLLTGLDTGPVGVSFHVMATAVEGSAVRASYPLHGCV